jgi:hypothetical protein
LSQPLFFDHEAISIDIDVVFRTANRLSVIGQAGFCSSFRGNEESSRIPGHKVANVANKTLQEESAMPSDTQSVLASKTAMWAGRILSALPVLMLIPAGIMKVIQPPSAKVIEGMAQYGFAGKSIMVIGILEIACSLIYIIPRAAFLGAILLTGLVGGIIAANLRIGNPSLAAGILLGLLVWGGLFLRDNRVRELFSGRR